MDDSKKENFLNTSNLLAQSLITLVNKSASIEWDGMRNVALKLANAFSETLQSTNTIAENLVRSNPPTQSQKISFELLRHFQTKSNKFIYRVIPTKKSKSLLKHSVCGEVMDGLLHLICHFTFLLPLLKIKKQPTVNLLLIAKAHICIRSLRK